ncbi:MAG: M1 family aminopeptidase [Bdellovibrionota bacterium]
MQTFKSFLSLFLFFCVLPTTSNAAFVSKKRPLDALHYRLEFAIDPATNPDELRAETQVRLRLTAPAKSVTLDAKGLKIHKTQLLQSKGWRTVKHSHANDELTFFLPTRYKKGATLNLKVDYTAPIQTKTHFGLFKVTDPDEPKRGPLLFTQMESLGAREVFPCNDEPQDKATTEIHASVPARYEVISNGRQTRNKTFKRKGATWKQVHWLQDKPHSTYLVTLTIGDFSHVVAQAARPQIDFWVGKTKTKQVAFVANATTKMVAYMEDYLGVKYPWNKYSTIGLPTFFWGGMENTSATNINQERLVLNDPDSEFEKNGIVGLAAHELAHQWFGDYVTMKWWDDLWLNESFASYLGTKATKHIYPNEEHDIDLVTYTWDAYFRQEDGPRSHPIVNQELQDPADAFDTISYTKGENVLRMLAYYVGENNFRAGLKRYLRNHALGNATYKDFFNAVAAASQKNLDSFRDSWLLQRGYPVIRYESEWDSSNKTLSLTIEQSSNHSGDKSLFDFLLPVTIHRKGVYAKELALAITKQKQTFTEKLEQEPEWVSVNPGGVVLAKVLPDGISKDTLTAQALSDPDPIIRVWANFRRVSDGLNDGNLSSAEQEHLLKALENDPSPYVRLALLDAIQKSKGRWLPEQLGERLFVLTQTSLKPDFAKTPLFQKDPHGWRQYRAQLLGTLGKVKSEKVSKFLTLTIQNPILPLDDLRTTATAVASIGDIRSGEILRAGIKTHQDRGYRYTYWLQFAFGAYENPRAAAEIQLLTRTGGPDLIGRIPWLIRNNETLRNSSEWAKFLSIFLVEDDQFSDDVKTRLLSTVEDVKNSSVEKMLKDVIKNAESKRVKESCKKILGKNFG